MSRPQGPRGGGAAKLPGKSWYFVVLEKTFLHLYEVYFMVITAKPQDSCRISISGHNDKTLSFDYVMLANSASNSKDIEWGKLSGCPRG